MKSRYTAFKNWLEIFYQFLEQNMKQVENDENLHI